ncbi:MAG: hypothetical protein KDJ38_12010 [Gammaproteobacteria bacterium]|nr:hypothetical protein [Gammaproteobacteria bacterium]
MKTLVVSLLLIAVAIAAAFFIHKDPGQVDVVFQGLHYGPMSLGIVLAAIAVAFIVFYIITRLLLGLMNAPKKLKKRSIQNRERKAHESLGAGLVKYSEGNFESAESTLLNYLSANKTCDAATYITAAKSANERKQYDLSASYLKKAAECSPESEIAIGITESRMLLQRNEFHDAVKKLSEIRNQAPSNTQAMWLLVQAYQKTRNWESMSDLLKTARKKQAAPKDDLLAMEKAAATGALSDAPDGNVENIFSRLPGHVQELSGVVYAYARRLNGMNKGDEAAKLISKSLGNQWDEDLAELYGNIQSSDVSAQLEQAEKWSKDNGESVSLLLTLGNLSYRRNLWGKAKEYILKSIAIKPTQQAFFALGKTLEAMDDNDGALEAYKHGYAVNADFSPTKPAASAPLENPAKIAGSREASAAPA